nr:hypothetical protein [Volvox africanus]
MKDKKRWLRGAGCAEAVLENAALFVTFSCVVESFSHIGKCLRSTVCATLGQSEMAELAHAHILSSLQQFTDYPCQASSAMQFWHLIGRPIQVVVFHLRAPLPELPRLIAPCCALGFAAAWAYWRLMFGRSLSNRAIMSYLAFQALNDTIIPSAVIFIAPNRLTTHSHHILPDLYTGPLLAAFVWLPARFVMFYSSITVLAVAINCLALSQGVTPPDPQQLQHLVRSSLAAGLLSCLYATARTQIWSAMSSGPSILSAMSRRTTPTQRGRCRRCRPADSCGNLMEPPPQQQRLRRPSVTEPKLGQYDTPRPEASIAAADVDVLLRPQAPPLRLVSEGAGGRLGVMAGRAGRLRRSRSECRQGKVLQRESGTAECLEGQSAAIISGDELSSNSRSSSRSNSRSSSSSRVPLRSDVPCTEQRRAPAAVPRAPAPDAAAPAPEDALQQSSGSSAVSCCRCGCRCRCGSTTAVAALASPSGPAAPSGLVSVDLAAQGPQHIPELQVRQSTPVQPEGHANIRAYGKECMDSDLDLDLNWWLWEGSAQMTPGSTLRWQNNHHHHHHHHHQQQQQQQQQQSSAGAATARAATAGAATAGAATARAGAMACVFWYGMPLLPAHLCCSSSVICRTGGGGSDGAPATTAPQIANIGVATPPPLPPPPPPLGLLDGQESSVPPPPPPLGLLDGQESSVPPPPPPLGLLDGQESSVPPPPPPLGLLDGQESSVPPPPPPLGLLDGQESSMPPPPPPLGLLDGQESSVPPPPPPLGLLDGQESSVPPPPPPLGLLDGQESSVPPPPPPLGLLDGQESSMPPPPPPLGLLDGQESSVPPPPGAGRCRPGGQWGRGCTGPSSYGSDTAAASTTVAGCCGCCECDGGCRSGAGCAAGISELNPLDFACSLMAAAAQCEYVGAMALRRVVIRVPEQMAPSMNMLYGWPEFMREELAKRHPDWHLLNACVRGVNRHVRTEGQPQLPPQPGHETACGQ